MKQRSAEKTTKWSSVTLVFLKGSKTSSHQSSESAILISECFKTAICCQSKWEATMWPRWSVANSSRPASLVRPSTTHLGSNSRQLLTRAMLSSLPIFSCSQTHPTYWTTRWPSVKTTAVVSLLLLHLLQSSILFIGRKSGFFSKARAKLTAIVSDRIFGTRPTVIKHVWPRLIHEAQWLTKLFLVGHQIATKHLPSRLNSAKVLNATQSRRSRATSFSNTTKITSKSLARFGRVCCWMQFYARASFQCLNRGKRSMRASLVRAIDHQHTNS